MATSTKIQLYDLSSLEMDREKCLKSTGPAPCYGADAGDGATAHGVGR
jgi:hypothetical protein